MNNAWSYKRLYNLLKKKFGRGVGDILTFSWEKLSSYVSIKTLFCHFDRVFTES